MSNDKRRLVAGEKLDHALKIKQIPVDLIETNGILRKPSWIKVRLPSSYQGIHQIKKSLRKNRLHSVCEEASCPNLSECFSHGTATFMILGAICTRRCSFCDVAHGKPLKPDMTEPLNLAETIQDMKLKYVVITSVDRDDLKDGGANHFRECIIQTRALNPDIKIEILTPDFRGRIDTALPILSEALPDVFNHNIENVPRLYKTVRPGSNYEWSLKLLQSFKQAHPHVPTKSGIMVGLGETDDEVIEVLKDLRAHDVDMLTIGQYLQPSRHHIPVQRYVHPDVFEEYKAKAIELGFSHVASGPMVRSSYHADLQVKGEF